MNMAHQPPSIYDADSPAVTTHLSIIQGVIGRMAGNSTSCKIQCVVLVTGIIVLVAQTKTSAYALLALIPTILFLYLDAHYLSLERAFRRSYSMFVRTLRSGSVTLPDLYEVRPSQLGSRPLLTSLKSASIWPFYGALAVTILLIWQFEYIKSILGF